MYNGYHKVHFSIFYSIVQAAVIQAFIVHYLHNLIILPRGRTCSCMRQFNKMCKSLHCAFSRHSSFFPHFSPAFLSSHVLSPFNRVTREEARGLVQCWSVPYRRPSLSMSPRSDGLPAQRAGADLLNDPGGALEAQALVTAQQHNAGLLAHARHAHLHVLFRV